MTKAAKGNDNSIASLNIKVIMPTYNAVPSFKKVLDALVSQEGLTKENILIIDSSSTDDIKEVIKNAGLICHTISQSEFGHGTTRQHAAEMASDAELLVYLTQDALLNDKTSIQTLCSYILQDDTLAAAYGRQLPYPSTNLAGTFARLYNYGEISYVRSLADKAHYGLKTAFMSDSFAVYRRTALMKMGGFKQVGFGEDTCMAADMLLHGYKVGYCAEATVYHSHSYTLAEEYVRSKIIGQLHKNEPWLLASFGKAEGEGFKYVLSEAKWLVAQGKWYLLPMMLVRDACKYAGYRVGRKS